jgi:N-acetyl-gamma-glutamyl-phosphate reductase
MYNHHSLNVAILGASGYTGVELVRLLLNHPAVHIKALSADKQAGKHLHAIFPNVTGFTLPILQKLTKLILAVST